MLNDDCNYDWNNRDVLASLLENLPATVSVYVYTHSESHTYKRELLYTVSKCFQVVLVADPSVLFVNSSMRHGVQVCVPMCVYVYVPFMYSTVV